MNKMTELLEECWKNFHQRSFTVSVRGRYPDLYKWVLAQSDIIPTKTFSDKVFTILNPTIPKCKNCTNSVTTLSRGGWASYCSLKCKGQHNSIKSRDKAKNTCISRLGVDNPMKDKCIAKKVKKATKITCGHEHALQSDTIRQNMRKTMFDLYGVEYASQNNVFKNKMVDTYQKNYGVSNPSLRHISENTISKLNDPVWLAEQNKLYSFQPLADSLGISTATLSKAFKNFNLIPIRHNNFISKPEKEIADFFLSQRDSIKIITSDRSVLCPFELDIYLPELNLAIEYNGLYYHSEDFGKDHRYHLYKTTKCQELGIKLIHIWENDYINNREIIYSKLLHLLGNSTRIYARKCSIKEIGIVEARTFLDKTHIQGYANSTVKLGLCLDNELVAVMTFIKSRFTDVAEWELLRFSSKLNHNIVGGFSKLLSHFIKIYNPKSIISYSDKCWSTGEVYKKNQFVFLRTSKPSYFYSKNGIDIEHRMSFQKTKMKSKLEIFDQALTESENMKNNGYMKIWNCGNDAWIWNNNCVDLTARAV